MRQDVPDVADAEMMPGDKPIAARPAPLRGGPLALPVVGLALAALAGTATAWLVSRRRELPLDERTRDRLRPRRPHRQEPSAADIEVR